MLNESELSNDASVGASGSEVSLPLLNLGTIWAIVNDTIDDATVNHLIWHCLGYCYVKTTNQWDLTKVEPEWRNDYPEPPDFIGSRPATVKLTRSIPKANKQLLKEIGFAGYKVDQLTPQRTRRATAANWLLSYMQEKNIG